MLTRRQAIAALTALPAVARIQKADIGPNDVIVIECDDHISLEAVERIRKTMEQVWPGHKVAVLGSGMRMKVTAG